MARTADTTTLQLPRDFVEWLKSQRVHPRQPLHEVLEAMLVEMGFLDRVDRPSTR